MNKKLIWIGGGFVLLVVLLIGLKKAGVIGKEEGTLVASEAVRYKNYNRICECEW
jgi:HlyD family secretion protein